MERDKLIQLEAPALEEIQKIVKRIIHLFNPQKIILFGCSVAKIKAGHEQASGGDHGPTP